MSFPDFDTLKDKGLLEKVEPQLKSLYEAIASVVASSGNTGGGSTTQPGTTPNPGTGTTAPGNSGNPPKGTGEEVEQPKALPYNTVPLKLNGRFMTLKSNKLLTKDKIVITLGNMQSIHVLDVQVDPSDTDGDLMIVTIDQDIADPSSVVGRTALVQDRSTYEAAQGQGNSGGSTPAPDTGTKPSPGNSGNTPAAGNSGNQPAPGNSGNTPAAGNSGQQPSTGNSQATVQAQANDYTGGDWNAGTWQGSDKAGISLKGSDEANASFVAGAEVTFVDGSKRTITFAQPDANLNIWFDGGKLDPKLGYPNTVKVAKRASVDSSAGNAGSQPTTSLPVNLPTYSAIVWKAGYKGQMFINLGMGAGGDSVLPGIHTQNYGFPTESEIKRAVSMGIRRFRVGFLWERAVKPGGRSELYRGKDGSGQLYTIDAMIEVGRLCKKYGATVKWDMHNYGGYSSTGTSANRKKVGSSGGPSIDVYANDWHAIIKALKSDKDCWDATYGFDTMNEWESMTFAVVKAAGQKVLDVCAATAEKKMFIFEGINYSSCTNWVANNPDYYTLKHPLGKEYIEFSAHLYLDAGADGYYTEGDVVNSNDAKAGITQETVGLARIKGFATWCKQNGVKGNIGENIVTGSMSRLMVGEAALLKFCVDSGIDVYIFGMGDRFGNNAHNIELPVNKPMLNLVVSLAKAA